MALESIDEEAENDDVLKDDDVVENDITVGLGNYMALTDVPLKYVNVIGLPAPMHFDGYEVSNVKANNRVGGFVKWATLALAFWFCSTLEPEAFGVPQAPNAEALVLSARILAVIATLVVVAAAFGLGYVEGQRSCQTTMASLSERTTSAERAMNAWAMVMPCLEEQYAAAITTFDRQHQTINAQRDEILSNREILGEFVDLRQHAERVIRRALDEATFHCDEECPMRCPIFLREDDGLWHLYPRCSSPTSLEPASDVMTQRAACPECAQEWMTPYIPNRDGTSLATAIEHFLEVSERTHGLW